MPRDLTPGRSPLAPARGGARCCEASPAPRWPSGRRYRRGADDAKKKKCDKKTKKKCGKQGLDCEKGKCVLPCNARNAQCLGNFAPLLCGDPKGHTCACSRLVEGGFTCAKTLHDADQNCPAASECERTSDCPDGEVCIDASSDDCCNGPGFGLCQPQCKI